jgi:hypothetical protein
MTLAFGSVRAGLDGKELAKPHTDDNSIKPPGRCSAFYDRTIMIVKYDL